MSVKMPSIESPSSGTTAGAGSMVAGTCAMVTAQTAQSVCPSRMSGRAAASAAASRWNVLSPRAAASRTWVSMARLSDPATMVERVMRGSLRASAGKSQS